MKPAPIPTPFRFRVPISNSGEGLHRFVDPVDNEAYLYTQFEVPDSRRMFPVFEQPDLKATFEFHITAPSYWKVIPNSPTPEPEKLDETKSLWRFAPTPRVSSYITALIAGPYTEWLFRWIQPLQFGSGRHHLGGIPRAGRRIEGRGTIRF